jgi:dephospho-CoA kinase
MAGKKIFITGIPTAGKSYLAQKLANDIGGQVYSTDNIRGEMLKNPLYKDWVNFYWNKDEKEYFENTSPEEQWNNLVKQSEGMWPFIFEKIISHDNQGQTVIFEGVNILPHLARKDLSFEGIVLIGKNKEDVYARVKKDHRWGNTEELWRMEADSFFDVERPNYKREAKEYGYSVFETAEDAYQTALIMLRE